MKKNQNRKKSEKFGIKKKLDRKWEKMWEKMGKWPVVSGKGGTGYGNVGVCLAFSEWILCCVWSRLGSVSLVFVARGVSAAGSGHRESAKHRGVRHRNRQREHEGVASPTFPALPDTFLASICLSRPPDRNYARGHVTQSDLEREMIRQARNRADPPFSKHEPTRLVT